jgi:DNA repair photolyase
MKNYKGKAIYNPSGKAGEYSYWACNFYVGCSNQCTYCFLRKGIGKATLGGNIPTLKKCFRDEADALRVFERELQQNLPELQKHGLFFTFTSDPCLPETQSLNARAILISIQNKVFVKVLTKKAGVALHSAKFGFGEFNQLYKDFFALGFTLTGHDELEPNASPTIDRIRAMKQLHDAGFKTWASIEPVIDFKSSKDVMCAVMDCCDLYKIGLESGKRYGKKELRKFVDWVLSCRRPNSPKFYFKDSLLKQAGIRREDLPASCVKRDYNIFLNK